jgi:hypothetical protein
MIFRHATRVPPGRSPALQGVQALLRGGRAGVVISMNDFYACCMNSNHQRYATPEAYSEFARENDWHASCSAQKACTAITLFRCFPE